MLGKLGPAIVSIFGVAGVIAYAVLIAIADSRSEAATSWSSLGAFSLVVVIIGTIAWVSVARRGTGLRFPSIRVPRLLLSITLFAGAVGVGFATTQTGYGIWVTPLVAVLATAAIGCVFLRLLTWHTGRRDASATHVLRNALWGMTAAPIGAASLQLITAMAIIGAIAAGLYLHDPDLARNAEIRSIFDELGTATSDELPAIYTTSTVALAIYMLLAFVAPVTEELIKPFSAMVADRGDQGRSEYDAFLAGASAGLGFGVVEALGYSLIQPESWPAMMLLRAPVITIHVAGSALVATGWYHQRRRERGQPLVWYIAAALALHGAWNGLFASVFLLVAGLETPAEPDATSAAAMLLILAALGAVLLSAFGWLLTYPRRILGRASDSQERTAWQLGPVHGPADLSIDFESR